MTADRPAGSAAAAIKRPKPPAPSLRDVVLYAPLGLALRLPSLLPELVQSGKSQIAMAQLMGRAALRRTGASRGRRPPRGSVPPVPRRRPPRRGSRRPRRPVPLRGSTPMPFMPRRRRRRQAGVAGRARHPPPARAPPARAPPVRAPPVRAPPGRPPPRHAPPRTGPRTQPTRRTGRSAASGAARDGRTTAFPIEGYDTLPASSIVALLGGLSRPTAPRCAVARSRAAARRTILARLEQLDAD